MYFPVVLKVTDRLCVTYSGVMAQVVVAGAALVAVGLAGLRGCQSRRHILHVALM